MVARPARSAAESDVHIAEAEASEDGSGFCLAYGPAMTELARLQQDTARAVDHVSRLDRADQEIAVDLLTAFAGSQAGRPTCGVGRLILGW
jgi:hypothetical protein